MGELTAYGKDEQPVGSGSYSVFSEDEYRASIDGYARVSRTSQYNPDGLETIDFYLTPRSFADADEEEELSDIDGNEVKPDSRVVFFFDPRRLGLVPVVSKNRKFLAAALGVSPEDRIELDSYEDLIGKELIIALAVKNGRNKITDVRPIRKRTRTRVAPKEESVEPQESVTAKKPTSKKTPVEAAKELFGDDVVASDDEY